LNRVGKLKSPITDTGDERVATITAQIRILPMKLKLFFIALLAWMPIASSFTFQSAHAQAAPRRIEVTAKKFDFTPAEITVKKGEPVVIVLKSADVAHGLSFPDLGVKAKVSKGQTAELAFTPTKTGDFVGQCSVFCGVGHSKMKLTLHVVD
jgi:cytochrome c oxidase subunit 2